MNRYSYSACLAVAVSLTLGACSSAVKLDEPAPVESRGAGSGGTPEGAGTAGGATGTGLGADRPVTQGATESARDPLNDPASPLYRKSIFFDFDSYTIRDEFRATVEAHAKYLIANRSRKVVVQGNTDERGSREYNLALGQKRAEAVRRALIALGVADAQIEAVSFGEEKPRSSGTDDAARAENRRADLAY